MGFPHDKKDFFAVFVQVGWGYPCYDQYLFGFLLLAYYTLYYHRIQTTNSSMICGSESVAESLYDCPFDVFFIISSTSELPAVAFIFVVMVYILFPRTWPTNLYPPCKSSLWIILWIDSVASSPLSTLGLSAISNKKIYMEDIN